MKNSSCLTNHGTDLCGSCCSFEEVGKLLLICFGSIFLCCFVLGAFSAKEDCDVAMSVRKLLKLIDI